MNDQLPRIQPLGFVVPMVARMDDPYQEKTVYIDRTPVVLMTAIQVIREMAHRKPILGIHRKPDKRLTALADALEIGLLENLDETA